MIEWTVDTQREYVRRKAGLRRAIKHSKGGEEGSRDRLVRLGQVIVIAERDLEWFDGVGWPDDWALWERARDDAHLRVAMKGWT